MTDAQTIDHAGRHRIEHYLRDWRMRGGSSEHADPELYQRVRQRVLEEHPAHSLYRSALIHHLYHDMLGGPKAVPSTPLTLPNILRLVNADVPVDDRLNKHIQRDENCRT